MLDPSEYPLEKTSAPASGPAPRRVPTPWLLAAGVVLAGGAAVWFFVTGRQTPPPAAEQTAGLAAPPPAPRTLCDATAANDLPSLNDSDALVGRLVGALSTHPRVTAWLATDHLIRNFTVVVENVSTGASPAKHLRPLRPSVAFRAIDTRGVPFMDPRGYARYAPIADGVDSVDAQAAARLCATLKPRLNEAYAELGREGSFDEALERAVVALLRTPALSANVGLEPKGALYAFTDEALEGLTPAQKHLARMGARNVRVIQDKLRQIALAIGIPRERLPQ